MTSVCEVSCSERKNITRYWLDVFRQVAPFSELGNKCCFVYAGKWRDQVDCAIKTLKPGQMSVEAFLDEAKIMHKLRHRKLVQLLGVCTLEEPIYIITELMVHGALLDFLRADAGRTVRLKEMIDMAAQVGD